MEIPSSSKSQTSVSKKNCNTLCKNLLRNNYIDNNFYKSLVCHNGTIAIIYGLIKIHNENFPLRPVVSTVGTPTSNYASFLADTLKPLKSISPSLINDFFFCRSSYKKNSKNYDDLTLVSIDVVSLFTNTPTKYLNTHFLILNCTIPKDVLIHLINFLLNNSSFIFNIICYKQIYGCTMGSPLSSIIVYMALFQLEIDVIPSLGLQIPLYVRYVDDILLLISE